APMATLTDTTDRLAPPRRLTEREQVNMRWRLRAALNVAEDAGELIETWCDCITEATLDTDAAVRTVLDALAAEGLAICRVPGPRNWPDPHGIAELVADALAEALPVEQTMQLLDLGALGPLVA